MSWTDASVPLLDQTGRFPDRFAPPSVVADKDAAEAAAAAALVSQNAAAASAGTATTQAGIATTHLITNSFGFAIEYGLGGAGNCGFETGLTVYGSPARPRETKGKA